MVLLLRAIRHCKFLMLLVVFFPGSRAWGQETVFDVPSADILDKGKVYGELDGTVHLANQTLATFTPRVVMGVGGGIELGINFDGTSTPTLGQLDVAPTVKWRLWPDGPWGWSFFVGDDLLIPFYQRRYNLGNYGYAFFAKQWKHGTRIGLGGYDFTHKVVATGNRAGGQFTFEQQISGRVTLAAEWYTGNHAAGYVNPGAVIKITPKFTLYTAYQIGNAGATSGNHQFLWELGYNFN